VAALSVLMLLPAFRGTNDYPNVPHFFVILQYMFRKTNQWSY